jgi:hypothetical protein
MNSTRRIAVVAGVLFIIATVADVISRAVFVQPILSAPDYLTGISANEGQVLLGALFLLIGAVAAAGIAIALYPVLRKTRLWPLGRGRCPATDRQVSSTRSWAAGRSCSRSPRRSTRGRTTPPKT